MQFTTTALFTLLSTIAMGASIPAARQADTSISISPSELLDSLADLNITINADTSISTSSSGNTKRDNLPGLSCDLSTATTCAENSAGTLAVCFWAAVSTGRNIEKDTICLGTITSFGSNLPDACKTCIGQ